MKQIKKPLNIFIAVIFIMSGVLGNGKAKATVEHNQIVNYIRTDATVEVKKVKEIEVLLGQTSTLDNSSEGLSGNITWEIIDDTLHIKPVEGTDSIMKDYSEYGESAPWKNKRYTDIVIEEGVTSIGNYAFYASMAKNVTIADTVTTIGEGAFKSNDYLEIINIPKSIKSIGNSAFAYSTNSSLIINFDCENMPNIGYGAFNCVGLYKPATINVKSPYIKQQLSELDNLNRYAKFSINGTTNISATNITQMVDKEYSGKEIEQSIIVKHEAYILQPNIDYKVSYSNNMYCGTATVTIVGIGYYTGSLNKTFKIIPKLDKKEISLFTQSSSTVKMLGASTAVTWKSNNPSIAVIDSKGNITGKKAGKTTITATANGFTATCTVTVKEISISKASLSIYIGDKQTLGISGANGKITWKSSDVNVVSVDTKGIVTAKKGGTATITGTYNGKAYTCKVTATSRPIIIITAVNWDINYAGGVDPTIKFKNNSGKTIKYVEFETSYYNRVGDPAKCDIWDSNKKTLQITGPIKSGEVYSGYWDAVIYNNQMSRIDINKIKVTYMDASVVTINYNRQWHDKNYYKQ